MKVKFGHYELRVCLGILSEDMPKAFWFSSVYDLDDDDMLGIGEPKETKREAVEEGKIYSPDGLFPATSDARV